MNPSSQKNVNSSDYVGSWWEKVYQKLNICIKKFSSKQSVEEHMTKFMKRKNLHTNVQLTGKLKCSQLLVGSSP